MTLRCVGMRMKAGRRHLVLAMISSVEAAVVSVESRVWLRRNNSVVQRVSEWRYRSSGANGAMHGRADHPLSLASAQHEPLSTFPLHHYPLFPNLISAVLTA
jgi:hypothetical protein